MRAAFVAPWGERLGGAEQMLWTFLRHVDRTRVEPVVVFLGGGQWPEEVRSIGIAVEVIPAGRLRQVRRYVATVRELRRTLSLLEVDAVVAWSAKAHLYAAPAVSRTGVLSAWWQQGIPARHWMDKLATRLPSQLVLCYSEAAATAQRRLRPSRPTVVVHPGVEILAEPPPRDRESLGIPSGRFVVGIVGRLQPWKRQHVVIEAVAELRAAGIDAHALVVGGAAYGLSPDYPGHLSGLVRTLGVGDAVTFTGQVPDPNRYLGAADVLVNASAAEPFGIVLLEGMAVGVPVIAFAAGGPLEIVEDGVSGLLVQEGGLAPALERVARDPGLARRLAEGGRARVASAFSAEAMTRRLEHALQTELGAA